MTRPVTGDACGPRFQPFGPNLLRVSALCVSIAIAGCGEAPEGTFEAAYSRCIRSVPPGYRSAAIMRECRQYAFQIEQRAAQGDTMNEGEG